MCETLGYADACRGFTCNHLSHLTTTENRHHKRRFPNLEYMQMRRRPGLFPGPHYGSLQRYPSWIFGAGVVREEVREGQRGWRKGREMKGERAEWEWTLPSSGGNRRPCIPLSWKHSVIQSQVLASTAPHRGDWLLALLAANCGLRLGNETVRVAVGLRLGLSLCIPHTCQYGVEVNTQAGQTTVCKRAPGKIARHHALNDIIWRAMTSSSSSSSFSLISS